MEESYLNGKEIEMTDLIERLRELAASEELADEAADEIERLQAKIAAMTKDMDSMKLWRELQHTNMAVLQTNAELQRENEELRKEVASCQEELRLCQQDAINALKAQSTEQPVAWEEEQETAYWDFDARRKGYPPYAGRVQSERDAFKQVLRNTTTPTATALVAEFRQNVLNKIKQYAKSKEDGFGLITSGKLEAAVSLYKAIESLPLIQGEK